MSEVTKLDKTNLLIAKLYQTKFNELLERKKELDLLNLDVEKKKMEISCLQDFINELSPLKAISQEQ